jgi:hypothetical protein
MHRILSSYWLAHFHLMQKSAKKKSAALFWFVLWNDGIFYMRAAIHRTIDISPAFLEHGSAKKIEHMQTMNRTSRRIRGLFT